MRVRDRALILGGGSCVWDDVAALEKMMNRAWDGLVIAANDIGAWWPSRVDHWVSLHPNKFARWAAQRAENGFGPASQTWGRPGRYQEPVTWSEMQPWPGGSSGLLGVQVAQHVGVRRVVLCGIPMTSTAHFEQSKENFGPIWFAAAGHWDAWLKHKDHLIGWVRSMSGNTERLLGGPSLEWLLGGDPVGLLDIPEPIM